jgi:outer membrane protein assembly factor BamD (BamD/ComL family)
MKPLGLLVTLGLAIGMGSLACADVEEAHYNAAVSLYNAGQWQAAVKKIDERLQGSASEAMRARYLYAKGLALEQGGQPDAARTAYAEVVAKHAGAPELNLSRLAIIYIDYAAGRLEAVARDIAAVDARPLSADDKRNLALMQAESLLAAGDSQKALAAYQAAIGLGADRTALAPKLFHLYLGRQMHGDLLAISGAPLAGVPADLIAAARAESLLALGRMAEAEAEAAKVPATSGLAPRAAFARAQALIKLGKLAEAVGPLQEAIKGLRNPPAPPSAHLALTDCLIEANRLPEAEASLNAAAHLAGTLPEADRQPFDQKLRALRVRLASASGDRLGLARAVTEAGDAIPAAQRGQLLYMKLYALSEEGQAAGVLASLETDYPVLQTTAEDGPASLIYYRTLKEAKRLDEGIALLEAFITRKPAVPESVQARVELAKAAMDRNDEEKALEWLTAAAAAPHAQRVLGTEVYADTLYNQGVMAFKLKKADPAIRAADALINAKPPAPLLIKGHMLAGQARLLKNDYAGAAAQWRAALKAGPADDEAAIREQLGQVLAAAGDHAGAAAEFARSVELRGSDRALSRESRESWARALYRLAQYAPAAEQFSRLYEADPKSPAYAYEAAVAWERAGRAADAERLYEAARRAGSALPPEYAAAIDPTLARLRMESGLGDHGFSHWLEGLSAPTNATRFIHSTAMIRRLLDSGKLADRIEAALARLLAGIPPDQHAYYVVGALRLQSLTSLNRLPQATGLADELLAAFAANEKSLDPQSLGATLAPAMIHYFKGDLARRAGHIPDALVAFETVLAAYPYNEWPDAAACGAAECYAALGDTDTAALKFGEVAAQSAPTPASAFWVELARRRLQEMNKKE